MKPNIHPPQHKVLAKCICTNEFYFNSALDAKIMHIEVCDKCHPFYTGKQQIISTTGRVDNFNSKFTKFQDNKRKLSSQPEKLEKPKKAATTKKESSKKESSKKGEAGDQ